MKSPFPGMDPYLERHWLDVHARLITHAAEQLNEKLPNSLVATSEERIAIDSEEYEHPSGYAPDVRVLQPGESDRGTSSVAYHAPVKLVLEIDPLKEHFIRVIEPGDERLITVIEVISPTNKSGKGLEGYRTKRDELVKSGVHVIEIDLVRKGDWRGLMQPHRCPRNLITEYRVTVRLGGDRRGAFLYPAPLRERLPAILVPLRAGDPEVMLELQSLVDLVYTRGRYGMRLDYKMPLKPPLAQEDEAWAQSVVADIKAR